MQFSCHQFGVCVHYDRAWGVFLSTQWPPVSSCIWEIGYGFLALFSTPFILSWGSSLKMLCGELTPASSKQMTCRTHNWCVLEKKKKGILHVFSEVASSGHSRQQSSSTWHAATAPNFLSQKSPRVCMLIDTEWRALDKILLLLQSGAIFTLIFLESSNLVSYTQPVLCLNLLNFIMLMFYLEHTLEMVHCICSLSINTRLGQLVHYRSYEFSREFARSTDLHWLGQ